MKRLIRASKVDNLYDEYADDEVIYENDNIITYRLPNGRATYDKHTGMLLSWYGNNYGKNSNDHFED